MRATTSAETAQKSTAAQSERAASQLRLRISIALSALLSMLLLAVYSLKKRLPPLPWIHRQRYKVRKRVVAVNAFSSTIGITATVDRM